jgi:hypothetical protein
MPPLARRAFAALPLLFALLTATGHAAAAAPAPLVTILDGEATLLRDGARLALAEGVRLQAGDLIATGAQARVLRIEFEGELGIALGPDTRAMLVTNLGDAAHPGLYVLQGWVKVAAPAGTTGELRSEAADASATGGTLIFTVQGAPGETRVQAFAESGNARVLPRAPGAAAQPLKAGEMLVLASHGARPERARGANPAFVQAMPRSFMDPLPSRAAAFAGRDVAPRRLGDMDYADAQPWIDAEPSLRAVFAKRWKRLAADPSFRRALAADLSSHPEWTPILHPQAAASRAP